MKVESSFPYYDLPTRKWELQDFKESLVHEACVTFFNKKLGAKRMASLPLIQLYLSAAFEHLDDELHDLKATKIGCKCSEAFWEAFLPYIGIDLVEEFMDSSDFEVGGAIYNIAYTDSLHRYLEQHTKHPFFVDE